MSEFSRLSEKIPSHITEDISNAFTLVLLDGINLEHHGTVHLPPGIEDPFDLDLKQFIPNQPLTLETFVQLAADVVNDAQERAGIVESERVVLAQEYQPEHFPEVGDEIISFKVLRRYPANMSRDGKSRPNRLPGYAYEYANPQEPNKILCIESRPIDHIVEFTPWAKTATLANARALWIERLLISQRWLFTSRGAKPFFWQERGPDTLWTHNGVRLHQRPIKFFVRLKEYTVLAFPTIKDFHFSLEVHE